MDNWINKIKNYNQILLAAAGTIGIILMIISGVIFISEILPSNYEEEGMIVTEEVELLNEQGLRKEIISFDYLKLIDSAKQIYVLPVTQASLDNPESSEKSLGLINSFSGSGYYGELIYNNIVVYYGQIDSSIIVFDNRLSIGDYMITKHKEDHYILASGCNIDSNKDNFLNSKDLQGLFVFNIDKQKYDKIETQENHTILNIFQPNKSNLLFCKIGVDRDVDGVFEDNLEPTIFMKLDLENVKLKPVAGKSINERLQKVLEGKS